MSPAIEQGPPGPAVIQPARRDLSFIDVGCELLGTFLLLVGGTSAVCLGFYPHSPLVRLVGDSSARLLITGTLFAGTGALVTISPLGRRSGAHLNPAVTLAFWLNRHLGWRNAVGYVVAQFSGALLGTAALWVLLRPVVSSSSVRYAATRPGAGTSSGQAAGIEALMTAALVLVIFGFVSSARTARYTPLAVWILIALLVWRFAPRTGTSLNPARTFGPEVFVATWSDFWVYVVGPLGGALAAVAVWLAVPRQTLTAKLFHDVTYPAVARSFMPVAPRPGPTGTNRST